jgi:Kef-type K+ transport system membrane component KefB
MLPLVVIVGGGALFRFLALRAGQPGVLGELTLGLLLGASVLGWAWPGARDALFPADARAALEAIAWVGLAFFMYMVGSEMRWQRGDGRAAGLVAWGGLVAPLALGALLVMAQPGWFTDGPPRLELLALVALVMSVSALPVLARILDDAGLARSRLGTIVLGAGTVDDLVAWMLLALLVSAAHVGLTGHVGLNVLVTAALFGGAYLVDRALPRLLKERAVPPSQGMLALLVVAILGSALLTQAAGLHAVLGPLMVGAIVSRHATLQAYAQPRLQGITMVLFLPAFFVLAGLDTNLTLIASGAGLVALAAVVVVASAGKLVGAWIGGAAAGLPRRERLMAGILLNARGAVGLVVARVGLEEGVVGPQGFALLVAAIVLTTMAAPPALQWYAARSVHVAPKRAPAQPQARAPMPRAK